MYDKLTNMEKSPKFHCFGHDHGAFGVMQLKETTFINAAQLNLIRGTYKFGVAWVFDY